MEIRRAKRAIAKMLVVAVEKRWALVERLNKKARTEHHITNEHENAGEFDHF